MKGERCMCGDPSCPSCGTAQGTYQERYVPPETDELYEIQRQEQLEAEYLKRTESAQAPCPECGGSGRDEFGECDVCKGHGYVKTDP